MTPEAWRAAGAGAAVAALAALAGFLWLRRALAKGGLAPQVLLQATALRLVLTLAGALALALGWREQATAALAGLGATYLALLAVETRWAAGRATKQKAGPAAPKSARRSKRDEEGS
jgi:hypothetical protein